MVKFMKKGLSSAAALALMASFLVGCGGGGGGGAPAASSSAGGATVTSVIVPAKGIIYGGTVTAYSTDGKVVATGTTGTLTSANPGQATLQIPSSVTGAILYKVTGNASTTYFDEASGRNASGADISLATAAPSVTAAANVGVTPFTTMAAKLSGINTAALGTSSYVAPATVSAATLNEGASRTLLALGLPANINLFSVPTPPSASNPVPTEITGALLAKIATSSGLDSNSFFNNLISATPVSTVSSSGTIAAVQISNTSIFTSTNTSIAAAGSFLGIPVSAPNLVPTSTDVQTTTKSTATAISTGTVIKATGASSSSGSTP